MQSLEQLHKQYFAADVKGPYHYEIIYFRVRKSLVGYPKCKQLQ